MCAGIMALIDSARRKVWSIHSPKGTRRLQRQSFLLQISPIRDPTYKTHLLSLIDGHVGTRHSMLLLARCAWTSAESAPDLSLSDYEYLGFGFISHDDPEPDGDESSSARVIVPPLKSVFGIPESIPIYKEIIQRTHTLIGGIAYWFAGFVFVDERPSGEIHIKGHSRNCWSGCLESRSVSRGRRTQAGHLKIRGYFETTERSRTRERYPKRTNSR